MTELIKIIESEFSENNILFSDEIFTTKIYHIDQNGKIGLPENQLKKLIENLNFSWDIKYSYNTLYTVNHDFWAVSIKEEKKVNSGLGGGYIKFITMMTLDQKGINIVKIARDENKKIYEDFLFRILKFNFLGWEDIESLELIQTVNEPLIRFYKNDATLYEDIPLDLLNVYYLEAAQFLIQLITKVKNYVQSTGERILDELNIIFDDVEKIIENKKNYQLALNVLEKKEVETINLGFQLSDYLHYYYLKLTCLRELEKFDECLVIIDETILKFEKDAPQMVMILLMKADILIEREEYFNSLKYLTKIESINQNVLSSKELTVYKSEVHEGVKQNFMKIPKKERKVILMSNEIFKSANESFIALDINNLPNLNFPIGHPQLNEVYIAHPRRNDFYLPLNNTAEQLTLDRVSEYATLLQGLGATSIEISSNKSDISEEKSKLELNVGVDVAIKGQGLEIDYDKENNEGSFSDFDSKIRQTYTFEPIKKPYIPEGLVWYHSDLNWQKLVRLRLEGGLRTHTEEITLSQVENVSSQELQKINVDLKVYFVKAGVDYSKDIKLESKSNKKQTWTLSVKFEDVNKLTETHEPTVIEHPVAIDETLNSLYAEYKEDVLFMLEDDGIIDEIERKMLNRKIEKYGLSKEEAEKIEKELMFNAEEVKYLDEYKMLLEEGEIGELERNMLDRYAQRYNISKDRREIIERSVN